MRTLLRLEDATEESPQMRALLALYEEDTASLQIFSHRLNQAIGQVVAAHSHYAQTVSNLADVLQSYAGQKFPLEPAEYEMPEVTGRLSTTVGELASWLDLVSQQLNDCVKRPVEKLCEQLDVVAGPTREAFEMAERAQSDVETKFAKLGRKDSHRKLEETNNDVFFARKAFHETALQYYTGLNAIQFSRYTQTVEPLMGFIYAMRSFFHTGYAGLNQTGITDFLTRMQEQMQTIHAESREEAQKTLEIRQTVEQLQKINLNMYYGEDPGVPVELPGVPITQKQGYLFQKTRSALWWRWERCFVFTQGSLLMRQLCDDIAGQPLLDMSVEGTAAFAADHEERRFTVAIRCPSLEHGELIFQARNSQDCAEWIAMINGYAKGDVAQQQSPVGSPVKSTPSVDIPGAKQKVESTVTTATPPNTPAVSATQLLADNPIQFDILASSEPENGGGDGSAATDYANRTDVKCFSVRFLGSVDVGADKGERLIPAAIQQITSTRALHNIERSSENRLAIDSRSRCLLLLEPQSFTVRVRFSLADIAYWAAHASNPHQFAFIARTRATESGEQGGAARFACHVFEADTAAAADVCAAIGGGVRQAFQSIVAEKMTQKEVVGQVEAEDAGTGTADVDGGTATASHVDGGKDVVAGTVGDGNEKAKEEEKPENAGQSEMEGSDKPEDEEKSTVTLVE